MSTERDIIIERLEQKLAARDKEMAQMQESLRESIIREMERRFADRIKPIDETRMDRLEHRLIELNSAYDGVMKELLDQKSIIHELRARQPVKEEPKIKPDAKPEVKPKEEKPPEKPKSQYIVAGNYVPKGPNKPQVLIEADEKITAEEPPKKDYTKIKQSKAPVKKSEKVMEGVEIVETLKKR